jgi:hypothetical protein
MLSFEHSLAGGSTCPERGVSSKISARLTGGNETIKSAVALATVVKTYCVLRLHRVGYRLLPWQLINEA